MPSSRVGRLTADDQDPFDASAEAGQHDAHDRRAHGVGVDPRSVAYPVLSPGRGRDSGSITATVPGASPMGTASTSTSGVVAVEQLVGEVDAADPEVGDRHSDAVAATGGRAGQPVRATSTPKPSSLRKMLPIPATSTRGRPGSRGPLIASGSTSSGWKKR